MDNFEKKKRIYMHAIVKHVLIFSFRCDTYMYFPPKITCKNNQGLNPSDYAF